METFLVKKAVDLLVDAIKRLLSGRKVRADQQEASRLIAEAITELLSLDPDLDVVQANLAAAESACPNPTAQLLKAKRLLKTVERAMKPAKRKAKKKPAKRKAKKKPAKRKAKKKSAKRKAKKKPAKRKRRMVRRRR